MNTKENLQELHQYLNSLLEQEKVLRKKSWDIYEEMKAVDYQCEKIREEQEITATKINKFRA